MLADTQSDVDIGQGQPQGQETVDTDHDGGVPALHLIFNEGSAHGTIVTHGRKPRVCINVG